MECAYCNKVIAVETIPQESFFVTCPHCRALNNRPLGEGPTAPAPGKPWKGEGENLSTGGSSHGSIPPRELSVELPASTTMGKKRGRLRLAWPWTQDFDRLLFFALTIIWYGLVYSFYGRSLDIELLGTQLPVLAILILIGYLPIAQLINKTVIEVNRNTLNLFFEPLPWPGKKSFASDDVSQIYCKEDSRRKSGSGADRKPTYTVNGILKNGNDLVLVAWLETPEQARFIEQSIEEHLGIVDRPVAGELPKNV
jgi:hypothetical protein